MKQLTVLDAHVLEALRMLTGPGESDVLIEVLCLFRDDAPARVRAIVTAWRADDAHGVMAAAHSLKGAASSLGADALQRACSDIEAAAKTGDLAAIGRLIDDLEEQAANVERDIAEVLRD
ncbi:MAG: Hpt domain-containing protein [Acidobacteria bacterium]|nr:Hpt domain-containing protein [Acidobacteriota bacterium]